MRTFGGIKKAWVLPLLAAILFVGAFFPGEARVSAATAVTPGNSFEAAAAVALNTEYTVDSALPVHFFKFDMPSDGIVEFNYKMSAVPTPNILGAVAGATTDLSYGYYAFFNISKVEVSANSSAAGIVEALAGAVGDGGCMMSAIADNNLHTSKKIGLGKGTYYFAVVNGGCNSTAYSFTVRTCTEAQSFETECNGHTAIADAVTFGQDYCGANTTAVDEDYFRFTLTSDAFVSIQLNHDYQTGTKRLYTVTLYDSLNNPVMTFTSNMKDASIKRAIGLSGAAAGTSYYIKISGGYSDNGYYTLRVTADAGILCETENNAGFETADVIPTGKKVSATNTSPYDLATLAESALEDNDYYTFTTKKQGVISLTLTHQALSASAALSIKETPLYTVNLYDKDHNSLYTFSSAYGETSTSSAKVGFPAGTYYVSVTGRLADTGVYGLTVNFEAKSNWECESNDGCEQANLVQTGKTYGGSLYTSSDVDFYKFQLSKSGSVKIKFMQEIVKGYTSSTCYKVKLYASDDLSNAIYELKVKGEDTSLTSPTIGLGKGTYYIKVQSVVYTDHEYKFKVTALASDYCERESNDSMTEANTLKSGKTYTGSIRSTDDADYYKIKLKKKGYLAIDLKQYATTESSIYRLYLYDKDKEELYTTVIRGNQNSFSTGKIGLKKGTYYILLKAYSKADYTGDYKLTVTAKASGKRETEPNNTMESADKITVDEPVKGNSLKKSGGLYEHYDYYKFTLSEKSKVAVTISHKAYSGKDTLWDIYVLDKDGNRVTHRTDYASLKQNKKQASTGELTLKKGTYYIEVYAHSVAAGKEYQLTVNRK